MKCSLCNKIIWFWQDEVATKDDKLAHKSCFEVCKIELERERKNTIAVNKELERLEKKRLDDAREVREQIVKDLDQEVEEASSGAEKKMDEFVEERLSEVKDE
jgi:hypothetical protein